MENSFLYSKSISFLTGRTRSTRPDLYHKPALPALFLSVRHCLVGPMSRCGPPVGLHLSLWLGPRIKENTQSPLPMPCSGHRPPAPILAPTLHQDPSDGLPRAAPLLPHCRTAVGAHCAPPSRDGRLCHRATTTAISCATPPLCSTLVAMRQPMQHGPLAACLV
jgi:hypothetical protein